MQGLFSFGFEISLDKDIYIYNVNYRPVSNCDIIQPLCTKRSYQFHSVYRLAYHGTTRLWREKKKGGGERKRVDRHEHC